MTPAEGRASSDSDILFKPNTTKGIGPECSVIWLCYCKRPATLTLQATKMHRIQPLQQLLMLVRAHHASEPEQCQMQTPCRVCHCSRMHALSLSHSAMSRLVMRCQQPSHYRSFSISTLNLMALSSRSSLKTMTLSGWHLMSRSSRCMVHGHQPTAPVKRRYKSFHCKSCRINHIKLCQQCVTFLACKHCVETTDGSSTDHL